MRILPLTVLVLSIAFAGPANAQLPGKLKQKVKKAFKGSLGDDSKKADQAKAENQSRSRPPARTDKDRKYAPGLSFSSVLNGVQVLPKNGQFRLHHIQATFLPDDCKAGWAVLRTAKGEEICQFDWRPDRLKKPYALLNIHKITDLKTGKTLAASVDLAKPGDYVLDFYLPTEHFYTFPFTVAKVGGDDPFGGGECYVIEGDWNDWAYLYYPDAKAEQSLHWKVWLRNRAPEQADFKIRIEIVRDADGQLVCTSRGNTTYSLQPKWTRHEFDTIFPTELTSGGAYFKAKDLLATDGAYTLTMKLNDKPYGVWKFAVEGGKLKYTGRALRGKANPLTFIEGGRDAWWYAKQKD